MLFTNSLHPAADEVNPQVTRPAFRFTCYHPVELVPSYRVHRGGLSVAVWFSRTRNAWIVRDKDLGIKHELDASLSHEELEAQIMAGLKQVEAGRR